MIAAEAQGRSIKVRRWMFGHHYKIQMILFRSGDDLIGSAGAVAAQIRMDVNHSGIFHQVVCGGGAMGVKLCDSVSEPAQLVTAPGERDLGNEQYRDKNESGLLPALQPATLRGGIQCSKSTEATCSLRL